MDKTAVLLKLDELTEVPAGTLQGAESIKDWDSINVISLIALADEEFNKALTAKQIAEANTIDDIIKLLLE